jgi:MFS family permease
MATCIISSLLLKKYGRKTILQFGTIGFAISNLVIFIGYSIQKEQPELSVTLLMVAFIYFMANFGLSLGPIIWLYIPEIVKPSFLPYSTMTNWAFLALVILLFPIIKARLPHQNPALIFLFFSFWSAISVLINQKFVVETMNKNSAQIDDEYSSK